MTRLVTVGVVCALSMCGCASTALDEPAQKEKLYRTGSNLPVRQGSLPDSVETSSPSTGDTRLGVPGMPKPMVGGH